jgi:hypothetical protein
MPKGRNLRIFLAHAQMLKLAQTIKAIEKEGQDFCYVLSSQKIELFFSRDLSSRFNEG